MAASELIQRQRPEISRTTFQTEGAVDAFHHALVRKKALLDANDPRHEEIQLEIRLGGGGLLGVIHAGYLDQLFQEGYGECISRIVGWSTGAASGLIALGATDPRARNAYYTDVAQGRLVDGSPLAFATRRVVKADGLTSMYGKYVDEDRVRGSATEFYVGITDKDGAGGVIDAKGQDDITALVVGSGAPPGLTTKHLIPVTINGLPYEVYDGGVAHPVPLPHSDEQRNHITHTLMIIPAIPEKRIGRGQLEYLAQDPRYRQHPDIRRSIRSLDDRTVAAYDDLHRYVAEHENVGVICFASLPKGIHLFTQDWQGLRHVQYDAKDFTAQTLSNARLSLQAQQHAA